MSNATLDVLVSSTLSSTTLVDLDLFRPLLRVSPDQTESECCFPVMGIEATLILANWSETRVMKSLGYERVSFLFCFSYGPALSK